MQNKIIIVSNVQGYLDSGEKAWLNAEDVARGFGFTQEKKGVEYVRWETINGYLKSFGFSQQVGKGDYIPENMVYRLGFKASNEVASRFQALLADEILPAIRKTGGYMVAKENETEEELMARAMLIAQSTIARQQERLKSLQEAYGRQADQITELHAENETKQLQIESQSEIIKTNAPKVAFADAILATKTSCLIGELAKFITQNGVYIGQKRLFAWLREHGYLGKSGEQYNMPLQKYVEMGLFEIKRSVRSGSSGELHTCNTTKVTPKGQSYFINKFLGTGHTGAESDATTGE